MNEQAERARHDYRAQARKARRALSDEQRADAADALVALLRSLPEYTAANRIGCYSAVASEFSLAPLITIELAHGRQIYLPHVEHTSPQMHFAPWHGNRKLLMPNRFGILEPLVDAAQLIEAQALDVLLLPLVAFDRRGYRLGSGAGYYDRALSFRLTQPAPPLLVGIGFACQECPPIPNADWDVRLDAIATECEIIRPSSP
jgi:5-formyltetrahydrofolate cyclo-ligase